MCADRVSTDVGRRLIAGGRWTAAAVRRGAVVTGVDGHAQEVMRRGGHGGTGRREAMSAWGGRKQGRDGTWTNEERCTC